MMRREKMKYFTGPADGADGPFPGRVACGLVQKAGNGDLSGRQGGSDGKVERLQRRMDSRIFSPFAGKQSVSGLM
jgi:hypothetical protein